MYKILNKEDGFSTVEIIVVLLIIGVLFGVGFYVYNNKSTNKTATKNNANTSKSTANPTSTVMTPQLAVIQLTTVFKSKDKAKFDSLISDEMTADAKANGVTSIYDNFAQSPETSAIFNQVDYSKEKPVVTEYASKKGVKGKTVTYTITTTTGNAKSVNTYKFSFVPKGNGWLLDDQSVNSDSNANIDTGAPAQ